MIANSVRLNGTIVAAYHPEAGEIRVNDGIFFQRLRTENNVRLRFVAAPPMVSIGYNGFSEWHYVEE